MVNFHNLPLIYHHCMLGKFKMDGNQMIFNLWDNYQKTPSKIINNILTCTQRFSANKIWSDVRSPFLLLTIALLINLSPHPLNHAL